MDFAVSTLSSLFIVNISLSLLSLFIVNISLLLLLASFCLHLYCLLCQPFELCLRLVSSQSILAGIIAKSKRTAISQSYGKLHIYH